MTTHESRLRIVVLAILSVAVAPVAWAQMQLPGALNGGSSGASGAKPKSGGGGGGGGEPSYAPAKPIVVKPPSEETIAGHVLAHDGANGAMTFDKSGDGLVLSKLSLTGDKISAATKSCKVDVALDPPLAATPAGRPAGAIRYDVPLKACPFSIDVLEGSVLVSTPAPTCDFVAADCRVAMAGLWGPGPDEITDKRAKELERQRVRIETTMRANFRVLLKRAGKDRAAVKAIAGEQAGFSSAREMACRDYAKESVHGYCSTQITEARVLALLSKFGAMPEPKEERKHARAKPRPAAAAPAETAPAAEAPDDTQ